ncbi:hypothetical protein IQ13_2769 [Lacibacter cauensis]|uniref:Uncharacterized protein n=1 Tax=Lacibacter cauensis TaxID=510947 RepID=A0A562SM95_9BACT|nr:hypothetical protein IQ13_2769 [Lacibacter cauensis]
MLTSTACCFGIGFTATFRCYKHRLITCWCVFLFILFVLSGIKQRHSNEFVMMKCSCTQQDCEYTDSFLFAEKTQTHKEEKKKSKKKVQGTRKKIHLSTSSRIKNPIPFNSAFSAHLLLCVKHCKQSAQSLLLFPPPSNS